MGTPRDMISSKNHQRRKVALTGLSMRSGLSMSKNYKGLGYNTL